MNKRLKQILILFGILIFPSLFYVILSGGDHDIAKVARYGFEKINAQGDSVFSEVSGYNRFQLREDDRSVEEVVQGKIKVISFLDMSDERFRVMEQMKNIAERFEDKDDVVMLTFFHNSDSVDNRFSELKRTYGLNKSNWFAASTDDARSITDFAQNELLISRETDYPDFMNVITLVDPENHLRGYYDGLEYVDTKEVRNTVKALRFKSFRPLKKEYDEGE